MTTCCKRAADSWGSVHTHGTSTFTEYVHTHATRAPGELHVHAARRPPAHTLLLLSFACSPRLTEYLLTDTVLRRCLVKKPRYVSTYCVCYDDEGILNVRMFVSTPCLSASPYWVRRRVDKCSNRLLLPMIRWRMLLVSICLAKGFSSTGEREPPSRPPRRMRLDIDIEVQSTSVHTYRSTVKVYTW